MGDPIYLASDHRGYPLKQALRGRLEAAGHEVRDVGTDGTESVDYPEFAAPAARAVSTGEASRAIVICGSGLGVTYTANRFPRVRAALVHDVETARLAREHNDANVLALAGDRTDPETAWAIVETWLDTPFAGGRHTRRVTGIDALTRGDSDALRDFDPEVAELLRREARRQSTSLELRATENFVSPAVLVAMGSAPGARGAEEEFERRDGPGGDAVGEAERLARQRARELFGADHVDLRTHSESRATQCVLRAVLEAGDAILAMGFDPDEDPSRASPLEPSGSDYRIVPFSVSAETGRIDYDEVGRLAREHRPRLIRTAATAYPRAIDFDRLRGIADEVGALLLADIAQTAGLVAGGAHPSPVGRAQLIVGTTYGTLRGPRGGVILCDAPLAGRIDAAVRASGRARPSINAIAARAVAFKEALEPGFRSYCRSVVANARALAGGLAELGVEVVSGGTDTHLVPISLVGRGLTGRIARAALGRAGIRAEESRVPFDSREPTATSGVRMGTQAATTRGMGETEMGEVARVVARALRNPEDEEALAGLRREVEALCGRFPLRSGSGGS